MNDDIRASQLEAQAGLHKVGFNIIGADECPSVYVNYAAATATPVDIQVVFALFGDLKDGSEQVDATAKVRLIMAPEHVLLLIEVLQTNLARYAQAHGKIRNVRRNPDNQAEQGDASQPAG